MLRQRVEDFMKRHLEDVDPHRLADFVVSLTSAKPKELQAVMECLDVQDRLDMALVLLKTEVERANLQKEIKESVEKKIGESQRKFMLNEPPDAVEGESDDLSTPVGIVVVLICGHHCTFVVGRTAFGIPPYISQ